MRPKLFIEGNEVDLFDDERIEMNLNFKDFKQFDKTKGDYTKPFTIPASKNNNKIFQHYYDANITTSFNPNVSRSAVLEINSLPYKTGRVKLEGVKVKAGNPSSYKIVFYDDITTLKEILGDTRLYQMDIPYSMDIDDRYDTLRSQLFSFGIGGLNAVFTPLISATRFFTYSDSTADIYDISTGAVLMNDVKPAVSVKDVLSQISQHFGINVLVPLLPAIGNPSGPAVNANGCLYLWCNRFEGRLTQVEQPWTLMETNSIISDISGYWDPTGHWFEISSTDGNATNTFVVVIDTSGYSAGLIDLEDITYEICAYNQTTGEIISTASGSGSGEYFFDIDRPSVGTENYQFYVRTPHPFVIGSNSGVFWSPNPTGAPVISSITLDNFVEPNSGSGAKMYFTDTEYTSLGRTYTAPGHLPNIKVFDFLVGLAKMFNWVLIPEGNDNYRFRTVDQYYANGTTRDWTPYVDNLTYEAKPVDFFGEIKFLYEPNDSVLSDNYYNTVGGGEYGYGDLVTTITDVNGDKINEETYEVKLPFTSVIWERPRTNAGALKNFYLANAVDKDADPVEMPPLLMYYNDSVTINDSDTITLNKRYGAATEATVTSISTASDRTQASTTFDQSINFGSEINIADNEADPSGANTLYNVFYEDFITDLYDVQARQYDFTAVLPLGEVLNVQLNDTITIGFTKYYINNMSVDLTTGKAKLNLRNVIA